MTTSQGVIQPSDWMGELRRNELFVASHEAMLVVDLLTGRVSLANAAAEHLFGYQPGALDGQEFMLLVAASHRPSLTDHFEEVRRSGVSSFFDTRHPVHLSGLRADGLPVEFEYSARRRDIDGHPYTLFTVRDLTGLLLGEERLTLQTQVIEAVASNAPLSETLRLLATSVDARLTRAGCCSVFVTDPRRLALRLEAGPGLPAGYGQFLAGIEIPIAATPSWYGRTAFRKVRSVVTSIESDPLIGDLREAALAHDLRACWATPIIAADGLVLGVLAVHHLTIGPPSAADVALVDAVVPMAAFAIRTQRAVDALQTSSRFVETVLDFAPTPFSVIDANGRLLLANRSWEEAFGPSRADAIGRTLEELFPPDLVTTIRSTLDQVLADGATHRFEYARADPAPPHAERYFQGVRLPIELPFVGRAVVSITTDVTELHTAEARFQRLLRSTPNPIYVWQYQDDDFIFLTTNEAGERVTQGRVTALIGRSAREYYLTRPDIIADLHACYAQRANIHRQMTYQFLTADDRRKFELDVTYVYVEPNLVMVHTRDITEQKAAERQRDVLLRTEKLRVLGQLAGGVAHDLNQSLTLIAGHADLALDLAHASGPDLRQSLEAIVRAVMDSADSVTRLLMFARTRSEKPPQRVSVGDLLRDVAVLTAPRWRDTAQREGRIIDMMVQIDDPALAVWAQPEALRETLTNLVFNAIDALPDGGSIRLEARHEAEKLEITVTDDGVGMPEEVRAQVFEPFFTTKGERGTGLGLAMVFGIIDQHRGTITVESAPGVGTTFRISLPLSEATASVPAPPEARAGLPTPRRILAVDDQPSVLTLLAQILRTNGHTVVTAASGEDALIALGRERFDLVISDLGLGAGMTGWGIAAHVRWAYPTTVFILASGWGADIDPDEARARGVHGVLAKPYRPRTLHAAIDRLLLPTSAPAPDEQNREDIRI